MGRPQPTRRRTRRAAGPLNHLRQAAATAHPQSVRSGSFARCRSDTCRNCRADGGGGADIGPLRAALGTPIAGLNPDGARYFDLHHARNDVFEQVNKRELDLGALNMALLIYMVDKYGL